MSAGIMNLYRSITKTTRMLMFEQVLSVTASSKLFYGTLQKLPNASHYLASKRIQSCRAFLNSTSTSSSDYDNSYKPPKSEKPTVNYYTLLEARKDDKTLIIDVREQAEIDETGKLPGSIHIPMGNVAKDLTCMSNNEFKSKYGKNKPCKDTKIILSCRAGTRSAMVQEELINLGYQKATNYVGGWLDWQKHKNRNDCVIY